jgi:WD40 repeat protein
VKLWNVATGKERVALPNHPKSVGYLAMTRDGRVLASGSNDGLVRFRDVETGRELANGSVAPLPLWGLAVTGNGKMAVTLAHAESPLGGTNSEFKTWDLSGIAGP